MPTAAIVLTATLLGSSVHATVTPLTVAPALGAQALAETARETAKVRIAILGLRNDGVDPATVAQVVDALALRISKHANTEVLTTTDIEAVLGLEATKQALDCDQGSCAAMDEITRALDVRYTVSGSIAPRSQGFFVYASLVDVTAGRAVVRSGVHVKGDDYTMALSPMADELLVGLHGASATSDAAGVGAPGTAAPEPSSDAGLPLISWAGVGIAGLGAIGAGVGGILLGIDDTTIRDETSPFATKEDARDRYLIDQAILASGALVAAAGAALIVAGVVTAE